MRPPASAAKKPAGARSRKLMTFWRSKNAASWSCRASVTSARRHSTRGWVASATPRGATERRYQRGAPLAAPRPLASRTSSSAGRGGAGRLDQAGERLGRLVAAGEQAVEGRQVAHPHAAAGDRPKAGLA